MRKVALIAGAVVVAVFAVGVFVGHWFGVGAEAAATSTTSATSTTMAWTQVALPVADAEGRVGPLEEFPAVVEAQAQLEAAEQALAEAEAALASAPPPLPEDPWGMPEAWQGFWCIAHPTEMREAGVNRDVYTPTPPGGERTWRSWANTATAKFVLLCGDVVATLGAGVSESDKASYAAMTLPLLIPPEQRAVTRAWESVTAAHDRFERAGLAHRLAIEDTVSAVVEETRRERGDTSDQTIQAGLTDQEWAFCDPAPELVAAGATDLGLLPHDPSDDLSTYWQAMRPEEYIRACQAAYTTEQAVVAQVIQAALTDTEWVFCDLNQDRVMTAADSLGFLSYDADEHQIDFWWVTRPDEFIRACKAAFALG